MKIRTAEKRDCTSCMEIAWEGGLMTPDYEAIPLGYYEAYLGEELFMVAEVDGHVAGFVLGQQMRTDNAQLMLLAVDLAHRRKGIGTKLVNTFKEQCNAIGVHYIDMIVPMLDDSMAFWRSLDVKGGQRYRQLCFVPEDHEYGNQPLTIESRWDLMYSRYPEKYDEFCSYDSKTDERTLKHNMFDFIGKEIVDIGSGTGESTFYFAKYAKSVIGVEPEKSMNEEAKRKAKEMGIQNVSFVEGKAQSIPLPDNSADIITGMYFMDYPGEIVIPSFIKEATRVLRDGGLILVSNDPPNSYGGELNDIIKDEDTGGAETRHRIYTEAGFDYHDVHSVKDFGTVDNMVSSYGFIFGMNAINHIRRNKITTNRATSRRHFKVIRK